MWGGFTLMTGLAPNIGLLAAARAATGVGRAVNDPTHNSLLSDYYSPEVRTKVYGFHESANQIGRIVAPLLGGSIAALFGWRAPFLIFWLPTLVLVIIALRHLEEPVRGAFERIAGGASAEDAQTEEEPLGFGEAWRTLFQIRSLRRVWLSLPFLTVAFVGIAQFLAVFYKDEFGLHEFQRGLVQSATEPFQLVGLAVGIPIAARLARRGPGLVLRFLALTGFVTAGGLLAVAAAPNLPVAIAGHILVSSVTAMLVPGILSTLSLAVPPRARSMGFGIVGLFVALGAVFLPFIGAIGDAVGIRGGIAAMAPVLLIGSLVLASAGSFVAADIDRVRTGSVALAEVARRGDAWRRQVVAGPRARRRLRRRPSAVRRRPGDRPGRDRRPARHQRRRQVHAVARHLRTPPARPPVRCCSTGPRSPTRPPTKSPRDGVVQVPGGKGVFTSLTVEENLKIAGWLYAKDSEYIRAGHRAGAGVLPGVAGALGPARRQPVRRRAADAHARARRSSPSRGC